jgi:predicted ATPase
VTFNRRKFLEIEETMKKLIPEIEEINVPTTKGGDKVYLAIRERKISEPLKYANISDGTLRVLAFVTALSLGGSLVAFEEPENCVHPYLFETVLDLCRKAPTQVIITTHSPYLVDKVKLEELYIVTKGEGKTIVRKIKGNEKRKVKRILNEGLTLGEIWYSGELGGIPHE